MCEIGQGEPYAQGLGIPWNYPQGIAALAVNPAANRAAGLAELAEFARTLKSMGALNSLDTAAFQTALAPLGNDVTGLLNTTWAGLVATNGNDSLSASGNGDFYLRGLGGNDTLTTQGGNDTLDGGSGDDTLNGGLGDDLYLMERGGGLDTINDAGGSDTLKLLGLNPGEFTITRDAANLYIALNDGSARARINGWFTNGANRIEQIQFGDGTIWSAADLEAHLTVPSASTGNDVLYGTANADTINGLAGNDVLSGQLGNDTLEGGTGNDSLDGGQGNDLYLFARGDGQDTVTDYDATVGNVDILKFKAGIAPGEIPMTKVILLRSACPNTVATNEMVWRKTG